MVIQDKMFGKTYVVSGLRLQSMGLVVCDKRSALWKASWHEFGLNLYGTMIWN